MVGAAVIVPDSNLWNAGMLTDEQLFDSLSYALNFLLSPPEVVVVQTTAQAIASNGGTATFITFQSSTRDTDGMWNAGTPNLVTVQTPGWYEAEWAVIWASKADTTSRVQSISVNGNTDVNFMMPYADYVNVSGGVTPEVWMNYDLFLNAGDTVSLAVNQTSGASLSTASASGDATAQTFLRLRWASK